jgi:hypothetical protein
MLPNGQYSETFLPQLANNLALPFDVSSNLGYPIRLAGTWHSAVPSATVPEAAVHENQGLSPGETKIGLSGEMVGAANLRT